MITYEEEVVCAPRAGNLYDVLDLILDRGMVIDVFVRVSLVGIEILKVDARIVVASVDTYLRFAEACNRLDLEHDARSKTVPELFGAPMAKSLGKAGAKRAGRTLSDKVRGLLTPPEGRAEDEDEYERGYGEYGDYGDYGDAHEDEVPEREPVGRRGGQGRRPERRPDRPRRRPPAERPARGERDRPARPRPRPRRRAEEEEEE
ncbi:MULTISPECIES: gas vesicle structural protein GvpA [unclassified Streptomyces]|uniref:gas vesicle structural protein GvpA n=1 Tax=unclassified Streptomyces TaxID=2593676 RepID=UPI00093E94E3|nr:gas vesicle structural protein GvpA [Streptomyces sp. TSRI0107]OKJ82183.1 gas vesicle protein [Streptomyces sp. TSRI0107]